MTDQEKRCQQCGYVMTDIGCVHCSAFKAKDNVLKLAKQAIAGEFAMKFIKLLAEEEVISHDRYKQFLFDISKLA